MAFYRGSSQHFRSFKSSDDTAIVGRGEGGREDEHRDMVSNFSKWCRENHLQLSVARLKRWWWISGGTSPLQSAFVGQMEIVQSYWVWCSVNKLEWSTNTEAVYKKGLSQLHVLRRLRSFNICKQMLQMFYQSVVASTIFFTVVSWGVGIKGREQIINSSKRAESVVGSKLVTLEEVEDRTLAELLAIMDSASHPLHKTLDNLKSSFSNRVIQPCCLKERQRKLFLPGAIRLHDTQILCFNLLLL